MVIPQGFIGDFIIAVGVLGVGVPFRYGPDLTIFIGHHNVAFAGGLAGELEGHIGESPHVRPTALTNLNELQVSTDHLVVGSVAVPELDDLSILTDLEGADDLVGVEVPFSRLALHHLVGAVGQSANVRLGDAVHHLDGGAHLARFIQSAVHIHGVHTLIGDFKKGSIQAGPTQGCKQARF